jgi:lipid II:glycine glycyltransferase (peptidoglycan interpeptide bridge formation enzyme)
LDGLPFDDRRWDAFVESSSTRPIPQLTAWALANASDGWRMTRVATSTPSGVVGGQLLLHRMSRSPWSRAYAPRGPVAEHLDAGTIAAFTRVVREEARRLRVVSVVIDPEVEAGAGWEARLAAEGWQRNPEPSSRTRIIDLTLSEEAILAGMHRKCRQSIAKAERLGVRTREGTGDDVAVFHALHVATQHRAGRKAHSEGYFRGLWEGLAPRGAIRLLFAVAPGTEEPLATVLLVSCAGRVADVYGGTSTEGERRRANYLLKWEAIRSSRAAGLREYDLWGLPSPGVAEFKRAFGGREVEYVGFWSLVTDRLGWSALRLVRLIRGGIRRDRTSAPDGGTGDHAHGDGSRGGLDDGRSG